MHPHGEQLLVSLVRVGFSMTGRLQASLHGTVRIAAANLGLPASR